MIAGQPQRLDEVTTLVLAPNPGLMTLEGTNTYLIGTPGSGECVIVDPGPDLLAHREAVDAALRELDATVAGVLVTHHHEDHAEAASWAVDWGATVWSFTPGLIEAPAEALQDGVRIQRGGVTVEAVHTPGHASDHLCLRVAESGVVLTGDHVLGRGTSVVAWPDGNMTDYVASLRRLAMVEASGLYPGHGPMIENAAEKLEEYLTHRLEREDQVLAALAAGDRTPAEIVSRVYADVDQSLHEAAGRSVRAHLDKLVEERRITFVPGPGDAEGSYRG
ncbi:MAG: MBL fold metallo-hydrolase [Acidimicrobiia bacterium]